MKKIKNLENIIKTKIYNIRGMQVMLDRDLATLYEVENRALKQAVKRNKSKFPSDFMFELSNNEVNNLVSQSVIPSKKQLGGALPFAFSEQGVASLSSVLSSKIANEIHISIIRTFVEMRKIISQNTLVLQEVEVLKTKQLKTDKKVDFILSAIENKDIQIKPQIFFNGKVFDAHSLLSKLIKKAKKDIVLIDNYIDENTLSLLTKRKKACKATIYTKSISKTLKLDLEKHNEQYPEIKIKVFKKSHDRFLILDKKEVYHIGASLKDLGKKICAISKFEIPAGSILKALK